MKLSRVFTATVIIAVAAAALAASGGARPTTEGPTLSKIAFFSFDQRDKGFDVMLVNTDGSTQVNITHDGTAKQNVDPNWSLNGLKVAFASYNTFGGADIMVVNESGKGLINLTRGPFANTRVQNLHPTWAPDGSIVFASNRDGNFDLYRISAATDAVTRLTTTAAPVQNLEPDFSANGKFLVFSRITGPASANPTAASLFVMAPTPGAPALQLTRAFRGMGDRGAAWSPNSRQIAFYSDRTGNNELYIINFVPAWSSLATPWQLTHTKANDLEPSWSPAGTSLVFLSDRSGQTELWMTTLMGAGIGDPPAWQVTFDKGLKGAPDWQPLGPVPSP
jgi:Tol biopolymer transport system component